MLHQVVLLALEVLAELSSSHAEREIAELRSEFEAKQREQGSQVEVVSGADTTTTTTTTTTTAEAPCSVAESSSVAITSVSGSPREHRVAKASSGTSISPALQMSNDAITRLAEMVLPTLQRCGSDNKLTIFFTRLICSLLSLFSTDRHLLDKRGGFIIRYVL